MQEDNLRRAGFLACRVSGTNMTKPPYYPVSHSYLVIRRSFAVRCFKVQKCVEYFGPIYSTHREVHCDAHSLYGGPNYTIEVRGWSSATKFQR